MSEKKVKKIRVKQADGTMSDYIPLGANAEDIDLKNGNNIEEEIKDLWKELNNKGDGSGEIKIETDPIFKASAAYGIKNTDINNWNNKSNFSGNYNDLSNKPNFITVTEDEIISLVDEAFSE